MLFTNQSINMMVYVHIVLFAQKQEIKQFHPDIIIIKQVQKNETFFWINKKRFYKFGK